MRNNYQNKNNCHIKMQSQSTKERKAKFNL